MGKKKRGGKAPPKDKDDAKSEPSTSSAENVTRAPENVPEVPPASVSYSKITQPSASHGEADVSRPFNIQTEVASVPAAVRHVPQTPSVLPGSAVQENIGVVGGAAAAIIQAPPVAPENVFQERKGAFRGFGRGRGAAVAISQAPPVAPGSVFQEPKGFGRGRGTAPAVSYAPQTPPVLPGRQGVASVPAAVSHVPQIPPVLHGSAVQGRQDVASVPAATSHVPQIPHILPPAAALPAKMEQLSVSPKKWQGKGTKMEIETISSHSSSKTIKPKPRPNYGTRGRKIQLKANFFPMNFNNDMVIYHYDVAINPEINSKEKIRNIFNSFVKNNSAKFLKTFYPVFDGRKNMYTHKPLPIGEIPMTFEIKLESDGERAKPFRITIKLAAQLSLSSLASFYNKKSDYPQDVIQAMDVVLRETATTRFVSLRQYFFTEPINEMRLDAPGVELWSGYYQSVRPTWKCMMLQVDASVRVFHKGQRVIDLCAEFFSCSVAGLKERPMNEIERSNFEKHIKGLQVEIDTERFKVLTRRSYKLIGLSKNVAQSQTFPMAQPDGKDIQTKVGAYFKSQYNINLEFPDLHCLQAQPAEKHRYLPMEICVVKKGQQLKKLSEALTSQLIKYSAVPATQRELKIEKLVNDMDLERDSIAKAFGLTISKKMIEFEGRVLEAPKIEYSANEKISVRNGSWNMQRAKFYSTCTVNKMAVLSFVPNINKEIYNFVDKLLAVARGVGLILPRPIEPYGCGRYANDVDRLMKGFQQQNVDLLLVVLPSQKSNDIYGQVKLIGDLEIGVVTQCVQLKNVRFVKDQTLTNLCLKINAKLGQTNSIIDQTNKTEMMKRPVMIMGADVTHPAPGDTSQPSIAAVTGSYDVKACCYAARISMQKHRQEIIADLESITVELLQNFEKHLKRYPERIIFYRDGVSEGQFKEVLSTELQAIQKACYKIKNDYQPAITFITVQKRHHTRLFPKNPGDRMGKSNNVPAGTTADSVITHPIDFDFYLCSHEGIQGTSRPAHYYVLYDDSDFSADDIQELTYRLCHVYVRCMRSVSIPAPAYYAHHCAFRGRYYLDRLGAEGKLPEDDGAAKRTLQAMNNKCLINARYTGMFFA